MQHRSKKPVVLVVDDEALIRIDAAEALAAAGFRVLEASNADQAIELLETRPDIELVYTDVAMPGSMDGLALAHCIANRWPPVRLLVTTAHVHIDRSDLPEGAEFCPKPCPVEEVVAVAETLVRPRDRLQLQ
jgi:DNA-binding NtrC family response regulator